MKTLIQYIIEALGEVNGFCILKPEFLDHEEDFCTMLTNNGWKIVQKQVRTLSPEEAKELYKDKSKEDYYDALCKYMSSGDCLSCMCYKDCEDPIGDMKKLKDKVRKTWGKDDMKNAMHSSDSIDNVNREYKLIFEKKGCNS
jgi:nucleoside diphosphate kinase